MEVRVVRNLTKAARQTFNPRTGEQGERGQNDYFENIEETRNQNIQEESSESGFQGPESNPEKTVRKIPKNVPPEGHFQVRVR